MEPDRPDLEQEAPGASPDAAPAAPGGGAAGLDETEEASAPAGASPDEGGEAEDIPPSADADDFDRTAAREMERLAREWSGDGVWQENLAHGRAFVERFGDDASHALLDGLGLGDHAAVLRIVARAGRHIAELERRVTELDGEAPVPPAGRGKPAALSDARRRALEDEHRRLRAGRDYWTDGGAARRRVREIMETLHGRAPIPVHGARGDGGVR